MSYLRNVVPWWLRIGTKLVLSRLPIPYSFWKRLHLFEHGDMNQPARALQNFQMHAKAAGFLNEKSSFRKASDHFNVLELGPGDSLFSILVAKALGADHTWLVDVDSFAQTELASYREMLGFLQEKGFPIPFETQPDTLDCLLELCGGDYLIEGVKSLEKVKSESVDFCFSQTVLQHVPKREFKLLASELFRILKPNGVSHHRVDLKDMLGGGLNNLRLPDTIWESELFCNSTFYTNRIRFREMIQIFEQAGFTVSLPVVIRWEELPTPRDKLDGQFRQLSDDDLLVQGFDILLKK